MGRGQHNLMSQLSNLLKKLASLYSAPLLILEKFSQDRVTRNLLGVGFQRKINCFSHYLDIFIWCDENSTDIKSRDEFLF